MKHVYRSLLFVAFAGALFGVVVHLSTLRHVALLEGELGRFLVPSVSFEGGQYEIEHGTVVGTTSLSSFDELGVLRLAWYALAARVDPVFALPGTDIEKFEESVGLLEQSLEEIVESQQHLDGELLRESLYPLAFLRSLTETEHARRVLVEEASMEHARQYHEALLVSIEEYVAFTRALEKVGGVIDEEGQYPDAVMKFLNGTSDFAYLQNIYKQYRKSAIAQREKERERWQCLQRRLGVCSPPHVPTKMVPLDESDEAAETTPSLITQEVFSIIDAVRTNFTKGIFDARRTATLESSLCYTDKQPVSYYLWWLPVENGRAFRPNILNDLLFIDTESDMNRDREYFAAARESGTRYFFQPIANHYLCPDLASDFAVLETMLFVDRVLAEKPLLGARETDNETLNDALQNLAARERAVRESETLHERDVQAYIASLGAIFEQFDENELARYFTEEDVLRAEQALVVYALRSPYYDELILSVVGNNKAVPEFALRGQFFNLPALIYTRGVQKALLAGFNTSFIREAGSLTEHPAPITQNDWFVPYARIRTFRSPDALIRILNDAYEFELNTESRR